MRLLVDTDAFCKLGVGGLLRDAVSLLGADLSECSRLPALTHMLRRGQLLKLFGLDTCQMLVPIAEGMPQMTQPSTAWLDKLTHVQGIDPGEAQLFAAAAETGLIVVSGDKRALRALRTVPGFADALAGRIVVLEAMLIALCDHLGLAEVRSRVPAMGAVDKSVKVCFSAGNADPCDALLSYYRSLVAELAPLVLWNPRSGGAT